jgi:hypothetical protein
VGNIDNDSATVSVTDQYLGVAKKKQRPRTHSENTRYLLNAWKPLHSLSVFKISRRHIATRVADIEIENGAVSAARARTALSTMFNWAIREGLDTRQTRCTARTVPNSRSPGTGCYPMSS